MAATAAIAVVSGILGNEFIARPAQDARDDAKRASKKAEDDQRKLMEEAKTRQVREESAASTVAAREAARNRQRAASSAGTGRAGTILTGPMGLPGAAAAGAGKTILGG